MHRARLVLRQWREERREMVRQYVGHHWGESSTREKVPVNLLSLYTQIVGQHLIAKEPRVMLSTFHKEHRPAVTAMQAWTNKEVVRMNLAITLQRAVLDALFSVGVCKVALSTPGDAANAGWNLRAGTPFCERVDLDDLVFDVHARDFSEAAYVGHRFRLPREVLLDSKEYGPRRHDVPASEDSAYNMEGDERLTALQRIPYVTQENNFEDYVDLWEVYIPRKRQILVIADSYLTGPESKPLLDKEWLGPDCGPYHFLGYGVVPGNAMPKGPLQDLYDMNEAVNRIYRKLIRQAERQKEVLGVMQGAAEDGSRVVETSDGEAFRCENPDAMKVMGFGGPNQQNMALGMELIQRLSWLAGNLDIMGGLSPQSKTATQDKLLAMNASAAIADKQATTVKFVSNVVRSLCWYWWKDPMTTMKTSFSLPGMPTLSIQRKVEPGDRRKVAFEDVEVDIDPYSMQYQTPQARAQALTQVVTQVVLPAMPLLAQQGSSLDMGAFLRKLAEYMDMPDLDEIMTTQAPPQPDAAPSGGAPGMPQETTRNYVRESMPGRTQRGDTVNRINTLMGANGEGGGGEVNFGNGEQ
jgi:hypothetical protein